jgi:Inorganic pyrophosphatase/exopolyphosphatase
MYDYKRVFIIGHKNPDSDSVCSAIGYAYLKNVLDKKHLYVPARAGDLNNETEFVLERFEIESPMEIESLAATVRDMQLKRPVAASPNDAIRDAASLMKEKNIRTVPVVDVSKKLHISIHGAARNLRYSYLFPLLLLIAHNFRYAPD